MYPTILDRCPLTQGSPWKAKILKGVKNCNAFLQGGFTHLDEILGALGGAGLKRFW